VAVNVSSAVMSPVPVVALELEALTKLFRLTDGLGLAKDSASPKKFGSAPLIALWFPTLVPALASELIASTTLTVTTSPTERALTYETRSAAATRKGILPSASG